MPISQKTLIAVYAGYVGLADLADRLSAEALQPGLPFEGQTKAINDRKALLELCRAVHLAQREAIKTLIEADGTLTVDPVSGVAK